MSFGAGNKLPRGYKAGRMQQFTPEQMELFQSMFGHLSPDSDLSRMASGDQSMYDEMEAPAKRQFAGMQGQLASRFSGMGMGGRRSSGFQNTANQAASEFGQGLQSKRMDMRQQALRDLMGYSNSLLGQRPYENFISEKQPSYLESLLGGQFGLFGSGGTGMGQSKGQGQGGSNMDNMAQLAKIAMMFI